jgi:hypothetical protein
MRERQALILCGLISAVSNRCEGQAVLAQFRLTKTAHEGSQVFVVQGCNIVASNFKHGLKLGTPTRRVNEQAK